MIIESSSPSGELKSPRGSHGSGRFMQSSFRPSYSFWAGQRRRAYEHEGLVTILEHADVLELDKEHWNVLLVDEEASEEHKRDDKNWCQCHC